MNIRKYCDADWTEWVRMSTALFPDESAQLLTSGMKEFLRREDAQLFIAEREDGAPCGYVEAATRPYADGCDTSPVGYIEAWYTDPDVRRQGVGRALLEAAEAWALSRGYTEVASDARLDNTLSHMAHEASGYVEVDRVVQFRKVIARTGHDATG